MTSERILSIQSHVVYGYVGGKAAVFPLQCLGYDVDVVNTVSYTNHSGYGSPVGTKATAAELEVIFAGLESNGLLFPTRLLTGYIPNAEVLSSVARLVKKLRQKTPHLIYLLDPVIGDAGQLYVAADVIPVYRDMLHLATVIAPNWFEAEVLADTTIKDIASLQQVLSILHTKYKVPHIVITSLPVKPWLLAALPSTISSSISDDSGYIFCMVSSTLNTPRPGTHINGTTPKYPSIIHGACVPHIPGYFSGVGDLFSALLLAHFHPNTTSTPTTTTTSPNSTSEAPASSKHPPHQTPLSHAASLALTKTYTILSQTQARTLTVPHEDLPLSDDELDAKDPMRVVKRMRGRELALVQGQDVLRGTALTEKDMKYMTYWDGFWES